MIKTFYIFFILFFSLSPFPYLHLAWSRYFQRSRINVISSPFVLPQTLPNPLRFSADGTRFCLAPFNEYRFFSIMHYKVSILSSLSQSRFQEYVYRNNRKFHIDFTMECINNPAKCESFFTVVDTSENLNKF